MKIDLTCPIELWQYQLPTKDYPACVFLMYNLSSKKVVSIQVTLISYNDENEQVSRLVERVQDLSGEPQQSFEVIIGVDPAISDFEMELVVEKVWFDDGTIWRRNNHQLTEYTPNMLPNGRQLEMLRFVAGADAVGFPDDQGPVWLCVCGRANAAHEQICRRCLRDKTMMFAQFNQQAIQIQMEKRESELEEIAKAAREEASSRQLQREQRRIEKQKKRKKAFTIALSTGFAIVLGGSIYFYGIPFFRYKQAEGNLNEGQFDQAIERFVALGDFMNAKDMVLESKYQQGLYNLSVNTMPALDEAIRIFDGLGEYEDAAIKSFDAKYAKGEKLFDQKEYTLAAQQFESIGSYGDANYKRNQAKFEQGKVLFDQTEYEQAYELFDTLGDYPQAAKYADDSLYKYALLLVDEGRTDLAIEKLESLEDDPKAKNTLVKAYYQKAQELEEAENYTEAGHYYALCGDYSDAKLGVYRCIYQPAVNLMEDGKYEEAIALFDTILTYEDAQEKITQAHYQIALRSYEEDNFKQAYEQLLDLGPYEDAQERADDSLYAYILQLKEENNDSEVLIQLEKLTGHEAEKEQLTNEIRYKQALALFDQENYTQAIGEFMEIVPYEDSEAKITQAKIALGDKAFDEKNYDAALKEYQSLDDESLVAGKILEIQYALAQDKIAEKDYEEAIKLLEELKNYQNAPTVLKETQYAYGKSLIDGNYYQSAADVFQALGNYQDAKELYQKCYYSLAIGAKREGNLVEAGELFLKAGDYEDAQEQSKKAYDDYYADRLEKAQGLMQEKNYQGAIEVLDVLDLDAVPRSYREILQIYNDANYTLANQLYNDGKPYEALPYYKNIPDYKDVSTVKLERNAYVIIGKWLSESGITMTFNDDGTCVIDGIEGYYRVQQYSMHTGKTPDKMSLTHKVTRLVGDSLTLRLIENDQDVVYKLTRQKEQ